MAYLCPFKTVFFCRGERKNTKTLTLLNAKKEVDYIVLGLEDASRAEFGFLAEILAEAKRLGVDRVRFADTTGILDPLKVFFSLQELVGLSRIPMEFHAHNDLGMATANSLAAVQAGFKAISVTVGGIGERAGNAALEEVAVALRYSLNEAVRLDLKRLNSLCLTVSLAADRRIPRAKPIIGEDVFTHTSSIHIDGIQKDFANYQSYPPESVGRQHSTSYGKYSGRKTILRLLKAKGIEFSQDNVEDILMKILRQTNQLKRPLEEKDILGFVGSTCWHKKRKPKPSSMGTRCIVILLRGGFWCLCGGATHRFALRA